MQAIRGRTRRAPQRSDDGAAAVEFALVVPLLLLLVFGAIQFGIVMAQNASLASGARAGARYGVVNVFGGHTCGGVADQVRQQASTIGLTGAQVVVTVTRGQSETSAMSVCGSSATEPCEGSVVNDNLYVKAAYVSPSFVPLPGLANDFDLAGRGTYRCEYK
ncbi:MAG: pilus assembly protein [Actinomycetota bacterium]|nr:pilus assembly protein [Actinomycetota bacterium]